MRQIECPKVIFFYVFGLFSCDIYNFLGILMYLGRWTQTWCDSHVTCGYLFLQQVHFCLLSIILSLHSFRSNVYYWCMNC